VLAAADCGVADIVGAATIVFSSDALDAVTARAKKKDTHLTSSSGTSEVTA
jgi:hypothetical protein